MSRSLPSLPQFALPKLSSTPHRPAAAAAQTPHRTPHARHYAAASPSAAAPSPSPPRGGGAGRSSLRCASCGSGSLRENALGYLICVECGAQSADHMAITQEVEEEMYGNMKQLLRSGTRIKRVGRKVIKLTEQESELVRSQVLLHGFHCLLQLQCRTLVVQFGVPALVVGVVGRLWISYVAQWREGTLTGGAHNDTRWGETHREMIVTRYMPGVNMLHGQTKMSPPPPPAQTDLTPMNDDGARPDDDARDDKKRVMKRPRSDDDADGEGDDEAAHKRRLKSDEPGVATDPYLRTDETKPAARGASPSTPDNMRLETGELSMSLSIVFLYLACHLLRESITLQQLCTWVHLGRLPYFNVRSGLPEPLWQRVQADPKLTTFFHPQTCPSAPRLLSLAQQTAISVAQQMEQVAHAQMAAQGEAAQQAQLTYQQATQLRRLVATASRALNTPTDASADDAVAPALEPPVSGSNSSLLLRTWLDQLRLPPQLHPLVMELVAQLDILALVPIASKAGRPRKSPVPAEDGPAAGAVAAAAAHQHIMLMACLVLAVQLTYGTRATTNAKGSAKLAANAQDAHAPLENDLIRRTQQLVTDLAPAPDDSAANTLPHFLSQVMQPKDGHTPTPALPSGAASSTPSASAIAANWSASPRHWPRTIHDARTLDARDQTPFVTWVGDVVLARLAPPKDFDFYLDQFARVAATAANKTSRDEDHTHSDAKREHNSTASTAGGAPIDSDDSASLLSSLLACESVVSYTSNRRGFYHPLYSSLLHRCSALLGVVASQLHAATQRVIAMAKTKHGSGSVYINTQKQTIHTPRRTPNRTRVVDPRTPVRGAGSRQNGASDDEEEDDASSHAGNSVRSSHAAQSSASASSLSRSSSIASSTRPR